MRWPRIEAKEITHRAYFDQLTGLPNRLLFKDRLIQGIEAAQETEKMIGIIYLDIDDWGKINSMMGHEDDDKLLI